MTPQTGLLPPNTVLQGRYVIVHRVGKGGMGAVYQAVDLRLPGKLWAIKEMSDAAITNPLEKQAVVQAFQREAQLLATLDHANLPKVSDYFNEGGKHYLVMDFIQGLTLESLMARQGGPLPLDRVVDLALQLCDALDYLHRRQPPIIFRDLKPANAMIDDEGRVKLIDFGIARLFQPGKGRDTQAMGTPGYAAPEQYGTGQTDARSDIYALGVTLHHLLTQHDPALTPFHLPPARVLNPAVPPGLSDLIVQATQPDPVHRFQTVRALRSAMTQVSAQPPSQPAVLPTQQGQVWRTFTHRDGLAGDKVQAILCDRHGRLWFGTTEGLSIYDGRSWHTLTERDGLVSDDILSLFEDASGNIWVGADVGVSRYDGRNWVSFTEQDGLPEGCVWAIAQDQHGEHIWVGTDSGVGVYDGYEWVILEDEDSPAGWEVMAIVRDRRGVLWFGTRGSGVFSYTAATDEWDMFAVEDDSRADEDDILSAAEDPAGTLWFGTYGGGICSYDRQNWETWTTQHGLASDEVWAIYADRDGVLWFGTDAGLTRYDGRTWRTFTLDDGLPSLQVWAITQDRKGAIWVGTDQGVAKWGG